MARFETYMFKCADIAEAGLKGSFALYAPLLTAAEGGFQKLASDRGNYNSRGELVGTNHGISARFYEEIIKRPPTEADMRAITKEYALQLMKTHFWDKVKADQIRDQYVANTIVDQHINAGNGVKLAQRTLNMKFNKTLTEDNIMGPLTLQAVNSVNPRNFVEEYNINRAEYYRSLGNNTFINGWLSRIKLFAYENPIKTLSAAGLILAAIVLIAAYKLN